MQLVITLHGAETLKELRAVAAAVESYVSEFETEDQEKGESLIDKLVGKTKDAPIPETLRIAVPPLASSEASPNSASILADAETSTSAQAATDTPATFDAAGLPWDERIHSSSKAIVADGTWRQKRGVSELLVKKVEAELRDAIGACGGYVAADTLDLQNAGFGEDVPPPPRDEEPVDSKKQFAELMRDITQKFPGQLPHVIKTLNESLGIKNLAELGTRPEMYDAARQVLFA
jgi:hypothetical protein